MSVQLLIGDMLKSDVFMSLVISKRNPGAREYEHPPHRVRGVNSGSTDESGSKGV